MRRSMVPRFLCKQPRKTPDSKFQIFNFFGFDLFFYYCKFKWRLREEAAPPLTSFLYFEVGGERKKKRIEFQEEKMTRRRK